jgi:PAS domain S-box-containing protein
VSSREAGVSGSSSLSGWSARAVIDALPRAVIVTRPDGRIVLWNRPAEALYGWSEWEVLGRSISDVLVPVQDRDQAGQIMAAVNSGETWSGDFTVLRKGGEPLRVLVFDTPILDTDGTALAVVGASEDVTDQRLIEQQAADLADHLSLALDAGGLGTWRWDMATGELTSDAKFDSLFGLQPDSGNNTFEGFLSSLHPDDVASVFETVGAAINDQARFTVEYRVVWPDGTIHWLDGKGRVTVDESGTVTGTMGCVADITEQVLIAAERERTIVIEHEAAERERLSALRLAFLGEINDALAASPTRADVMRNVTRVAVPMLGDWCAIHVLPDSASRVPEMEVAHVDPAQIAYVQALQERFPYDPDARTGVTLVIRSGQHEFYPHIDDQVLAQADTTDEAREVVRSLALRSAMTVPLAKRGRVLGALQFVNTDTSRRYTTDDLALAHAVASRIASTLENRRLAEQQRLIATTLQASLLPDTLPSIPGLGVAVRYWPAGEATTVGGDFYDLFEIGDDRWAIVIGDVCGTGPAAAALTALARHTIRAAAWNGADPDDVLRQLNHAIRRSERQTFCTALYCTLTPKADQFQLTVTAGGHPLPIVHRNDGSTETIGEPGTLLGVTIGSRSTTRSTNLGPGDTFVLYTDGITDVRPPHDLTPQHMETMVSRAAANTPTAEKVAANLGRAIDEQLSFTARDDDIALLVLSVKPESGSDH